MTDGENAGTPQAWYRCNYCGHVFGPIHFLVHWPQHYSKRFREWYDGE